VAGEGVKTEIDRRWQLLREKPYVYRKFEKYMEKVSRGESVAIIQFQYDYRCNLVCEHCCVEKLRKAKRDRCFEISDVRELSRQADALGLGQIVLTGGEPLFFTDFDQVIEAIDPSKFFVTIDTNGYLLDLKMAKHLRNIGVDKVQLSLDSILPDDHDLFRGKCGVFEKAVQALDACQDVGLYVIIATVVTKERVRSIEFIKFLSWARERQVGVFCTFAKPVGAWEGRRDKMVSKEDIDYVHSLKDEYHEINVFTHLTPSHGLDLGCIAVKRMVSITKWGDVMPCPYDHRVLGNFFEEPLKVILERSMKKFACRIDTCYMADAEGGKYAPDI
jgi:MoaA/NifB/PqqE/SkfB family radical SAM enzyme